MTLTITDTLITSDEVDQTAYLHDGQWAVDGFPFRTFGQNGAITAMSLAELDASGLAQTEPKYAALAAAWREELGLPGLAPETTSRTSPEPAEGAEPDQPRTRSKADAVYTPPAGVEVLEPLRFGGIGPAPETTSRTSPEPAEPERDWGLPALGHDADADQPRTSPEPAAHTGSAWTCPACIDSTCGDCMEGRCHGSGPCGCDRHEASMALLQLHGGE